jgi:hypothetical protein
MCKKCYKKQYNLDHKEERSEGRKRYTLDHKEDKRFYDTIHKEEIIEYKKQYKLDHKEDAKNYNKQYRLDHKEEMKEYDKQYNLDHKEETKAYNKQYNLEHKEEISINSKQYRIDHKEEKREYNKQYRLDHKKERNELRNEKRRNSPAIKLRNNISGAVWLALKRSGNSKRGESVMKHMPFTIEELKLHLECQWEHWMTWENYGKVSSEKRTWNIDHKVPQSKLLYITMKEENFRKCWALSNLQPLEAIANIKKGNRDQ